MTVDTHLIAEPETKAGSSFRIRGPLARGLSWIILLALLVFPLTYGNALGNIAILAGLVAIFVADRAAYRQILRMPHIWMLVAAFLLLGFSAVVFGGATKASLIAFDFTPFVLAIPVSAIFMRSPVRDPEVRVSLLALAGTLVALGVALYQYIALHASRPGGWELSPIHYADIVVTLGFMSLAGLVARPSRLSMIFAVGPLLGVVAGIMSGTRAVLFVVAIQFLFALWLLLRGRSRNQAAAILVGVVLIVAAILFLAPALGFNRVLDLGGLLQTQASQGEK